ncbi:helix-turn-helix domain-containing protein [Streptomyces sp. NPDC005732]|uniref:helix-turn-helix domain-containing protein n=1 Tax=Streptomyces sp. NPDC005732 TaxID=3157057 RepID=UPI00340C96AB
MTRNDLDPPTETTLILRLTELAAAVERLASAPSAAELELKCFTPDEAAPYLGKTANWITEAIRDGRIPYTTVGRSPRLTAAHIRWIQANGERVPNRYAKPLSKQPARAAA